MIRLARAEDWPNIWPLLRQVFRVGETYAVDRDICEEDARVMWMEAPVQTYVWDDGAVFGTYYIKKNHGGGGAHICNCGYVTSVSARGKGIARAMCLHSQDIARDLGFQAMQFNLVLASNVGAVRLWQDLEFEIVGTLPGAFDHPNLGKTDAYVMWKDL